MSRQMSTQSLAKYAFSLEDIEEFIAGTLAERVKVIAEALQELDFNIYAEKFNMQSFAEHDIYPNIWSYDEETEEILDDMRGCFESLKQFYLRMAEKGSAVLVSIY
ncbi:MAG: YfbM family protein [Acetatifactor sp.]|nr:YfbM family protein [Acetatifactor sp.]